MLNFPVEMPYDFEVVQAMWTLGRFPPGLLPDVAAEAMVAGFEGPAVLDVASYHPPLLDGIDKAMDAALREMGRPPMTRSRAAWLVARYLARFVTAGKLNAYEWGKEMGSYWMDMSREMLEYQDVGLLYGLADSYEDYPESRNKYLREMLEEARAFATRAEPSKSR